MRHSLLVLCTLLVFLAGCELSEVYGDLDQADANAMLVLLKTNGVDVKIKKEVRQNRPYYAVTVAKSDLDRARALLQEYNLPRKRLPGLEDIFKEPGFIPTPQEQKARFLLALKGEIINSLQMIPDVVEVDVIVNMPDAEEFGSEVDQHKPTASVVMKVRPTDQALATLTEVKVQRFVANSVEKLDPRDVTVIISYTSEPAGGVRPGQSLILSSAGHQAPSAGQAGAVGSSVSVAGLAVSPESAGRLKLYLGLFLGLLAMLSLGLVVMVVQASRMRSELASHEQMPALEGQLATGEGSPPQLGAGDDES